MKTRTRQRQACAVLALLLAAALATEGCSMLRRRAASRPPFRKVAPPIAYEMMRDSPAILILDLRAPVAFHGDTGHVSRAYNIPVDQLPFRLFELTSYRDDTFLVYCDTQKCAEDGMAVLLSSGFENAILIDGGIDRWIAMGFRTVLPAELAGKRQPAGQGAGRQDDAGSDNPPVLKPADRQPLLEETDPHVPVQRPPSTEDPRS